MFLDKDELNRIGAAHGVIREPNEGDKTYRKRIIEKMEETLGLKEDTSSMQYTEKDNKTVNILGTDWHIIFAPADEGKLATSDGICDNSVKKIYVGIFPETETTQENLAEYQKKVMRHEIVHAFFYECGLADSSGSVEAWAQNEAMVDWIARQHHKLHATFEKAGAL